MDGRDPWENGRNRRKYYTTGGTTTTVIIFIKDMAGIGHGGHARYGVIEPRCTLRQKITCRSNHIMHTPRLLHTMREKHFWKDAYTEIGKQYNRDIWKLHEADAAQEDGRQSSSQRIG